eukprot:TRINITY_DN2235_c0_g3_i2.p1 TRINITY_DN2235_c0_g3~~TRINITY_DN2235_c0_g3_i2.p1  ORF type:complete len:202 (+),score=75.22 TRINITY_DN2235_c0_g3_i2:545-1150(+)
MMLTCLILAFKAEEVNCNPLAFLSRVENVDPSEVMSYESALLEGVKFQVHIYSPFDSLEGFRLTFGLDKEFIKKVEPIIIKSYFTDALLLLAPGVIAAAAIYLADKSELEKFKLSMETQKKIEEAATIIASAREPDKKEYIAIVSKIKKFEASCPEFMRYMKEVRDKKLLGRETKRKTVEGENSLKGNSGMVKKKKVEEQI